MVAAGQLSQQTLSTRTHAHISTLPFGKQASKPRHDSGNWLAQTVPSYEKQCCKNGHFPSLPLCQQSGCTGTRVFCVHVNKFVHSLPFMLAVKPDVMGTGLFDPFIHSGSARAKHTRTLFPLEYVVVGVLPPAWTPTDRLIDSSGSSAIGAQSSVTMIAREWTASMMLVVMVVVVIAIFLSRSRKVSSCESS